MAVIAVALLSVAFLIVFSLGGEPGKGKEGDDLKNFTYVYQQTDPK